jgi:N-acetylmuramoyl-L-alanine amidase
LNARSLPVAAACFTLAIVLALATVPSSQSAAPAPLTILSKDGRRTVTLTAIGDQEFVALDDLAALFQFTIREDSTGAVTATYKGKTIILTADQALASVAGRLVSLPAAPTRSGRRWLVPIDFISRALALVYDARLDLRKPSRLLVVGDLRVPRVTVRLEPAGAGARLTFDATPRATAAVTEENQRLLVKFDADTLELTSPLLPPQGPQALIQSIRALDATTLAVELGPRFSGFRSATQGDAAASHVVIDLTAAGQTETQTAPAPPPAPASEPPAVLAGGSVRTIVVDAGHGGEDEGVTTPGGTKEKDLTLAVARRLKAALEGRLGVRVLLTRDDDRNPSFDERAAAANNSKSDLFISLHANASLRASASGAFIFFSSLSQDGVRPAAAPGGVERLPAVVGGPRDIELVPWELAQMRHLDQSMAFATLVEEQFRDRVPLASRAVAAAPLRVLESANMPAVLIEMGYLTNPDQEKQLGGAEFQNTFVQAVIDAVLRFRDVLDERRAASNGGAR